MPNKIKKNTNKKVEKGKGVLKTLKNVGKKALPVVGALAALGVAGNLAQGYQDYEYNKYMEALDGRGIVEDVKKGVKKHGKKALIGVIGTYGAYKALTHPFIEVGRGQPKATKKKGKGLKEVKEKVKKVARVALPITGAIAGSYLLDKLLNSPSYSIIDERNYSSTLEPLTQTIYTVNKPEWALDVERQLGMGVGNRIVLEKPMEKIPLPIKKDEKINKFDYEKLAKYSALAIPAGVLAYYAYKNNIVPNLYNSTRDFFKKDPTMIQTATQTEPEIIPSLLEFSQETIDALDIPEASIEGLNILRDRLEGTRKGIEIATQTGESFLNETILNKLSGETFQNPNFFSFTETQLNDFIKTATDLGETNMRQLKGIISKLKILNRQEVSDLLKDKTINDKKNILSDIILTSVENMKKLKKNYSSLVKTAVNLRQARDYGPEEVLFQDISESASLGLGIKKKARKNKNKKEKGKGKGVLFGMKSIEKYKNII